MQRQEFAALDGSRDVLVVLPSAPFCVLLLVQHDCQTPLSLLVYGEGSGGQGLCGHPGCPCCVER